MSRLKLTLMLAGFALALGGAFVVPAVHAGDDQSTAPILSQPISDVPGPRRTVAVGAFDAIGPQAAGANNWNVGGSVAAMLTTALQESGKFNVLERAALNQVVNEQEMAAHHVSGGSDAPMPGKIIPAQYLIEGSVTEFSTADNGGGASVGGVSGVLSGGLSLSGSSGSVAFDIRIVNTRTTAIETSFTVRRKLSSTAVGFTGGYKNISLGGNEFWSTPLGEATRAALNDAVEKIAQTIASGQWQGAVVEVDGNTVYINSGTNAGFKGGEHLTVKRVAKVFTDPTTGEVLSERDTTLGTIVLADVEEKLSSGQYQSADPSPPVRGDFVVFDK